MSQKSSLPQPTQSVSRVLTADIPNELRRVCGMCAQVQTCLERAEYCERMASIAADPDAKARFADAAKRWRDTALATQAYDR
jgi:hypothetical protein